MMAFMTCEHQKECRKGSIDSFVLCLLFPVLPSSFEEYTLVQAPLPWSMSPVKNSYMGNCDVESTVFSFIGKQGTSIFLLLFFRYHVYECENNYICALQRSCVCRVCPRFIFHKLWDDNSLESKKKNPVDPTLCKGRRCKPGLSNSSVRINASLLW